MVFLFATFSFNHRPILQDWRIQGAGDGFNRRGHRSSSRRGDHMLMGKNRQLRSFLRTVSSM